MNDQYGHLAGDEYLKFISGFLRTVFRRTTDIYARYGGEEFIVLMQEPVNHAVTRAETVRSLVEKGSLLFEGNTIQTTISAGVAVMIPSKETGPEKLISRADAMLYQSKENGRNRVTEWLTLTPGVTLD